MEFTCARPVTRTAVVSYTAFPPLPQHVRRFISVALVWESPPPDVIRHPALRSPDFPRLNPFVCSAAITWPGCASAILTRFFLLVKLFCHSFYTLKQLPPINSLRMELWGTASLEQAENNQRISEAFSLLHIPAHFYQFRTAAVLHKPSGTQVHRSAQN